MNNWLKQGTKPEKIYKKGNVWIYEKQNADEYLLHGKNAERLKSAFNQINNGLAVEKELIE